MYIEFVLPNGAGGMAAGHAAGALKKEIAAWAEKYSITYKTKIHKYTFRVCLESDEQYTFFQLSWNPKGPYFRTYRLITPGQ
jgi:hypothetical protein